MSLYLFRLIADDVTENPQKRNATIVFYWQEEVLGTSDETEVGVNDETDLLE